MTDKNLNAELSANQTQMPFKNGRISQGLKDPEINNPHFISVKVNAKRRCKITELL